MKLNNEAINICLTNIGEPLLSNDESYEGIFEAEQAFFVINQIKTEVLSEGWEVNTDIDWPLMKDNNGYIGVPQSALSVEIKDLSKNIVVKDYKLYDKEKKTYKFFNDEFIKADIVWDFDFDDLPFILQNYIVLKAARVLAERLDSNTNMINIMYRDEETARQKLERNETELNNYSIFDNDSVKRIIDRSINPKGV